MSEARDFRPLGLVLAVSATISMVVGCTSTSTSTSGELEQSHASTARSNQFEVMNQADGPGVESGSPTTDLPTQEQILANLEDGRRFMESLQGSDDRQEPSGDGVELRDSTEASTVELVPGVEVRTDAEDALLVVESGSGAVPTVPAMASGSPGGLDADPTSSVIRSLMDAASQSDAPLKQHLAMAVIFAWVAPEKPFEPQGLSELTDEERQLVTIVYERFKALGSELEEGGDGPVLAEAFSEIVSLIDAESPFRITRMKLCSAVRDYGDIDVFDPPMFSPLERSKFIWYVELDGVEPRFEEASGNYAHDFTVRTEMLSRETGVPVVPPVESTVRHGASTRIRDLFLRNVFEVPESLQYGWYTIKVTVSEQASGIQSQMGIDLLWVPSLAAGVEHFERRMTTAVAE